MTKLSVVLGLAVLLAAPPMAQAAQPIGVVAAENFYGDVAKQIGGPDVKVTSILENPDQDPHLFEVSSSVARAVATARIVVYNGLGYDPWMKKVLDASPSADRRAIVVASLAARTTGDNPHVWYDTRTMLAYAAVLTEVLTADDPANAAGFRRRLAQFQKSMQPIQAKIAGLRKRLAGTPVTATEPIVGYLFDALGLLNRNPSFQTAVMNNTEPGASTVASFETDLEARRVKLLVYNRQVSDPTTQRMVAIAKAAGVPVVAASETEPPGKTYQSWISGEIDAIAHAIPVAAR